MYAWWFHLWVCIWQCIQTSTTCTSVTCMSCRSLQLVCVVLHWLTISSTSFVDCPSSEYRAYKCIHICILIRMLAVTHMYEASTHVAYPCKQLQKKSWQNEAQPIHTARTRRVCTEWLWKVVSALVLLFESLGLSQKANSHQDSKQQHQTIGALHIFYAHSVTRWDSANSPVYSNACTLLLYWWS